MPTGDSAPPRSERGSGPLVVGLTGGIGSGKSAVSRCFEDLGVPVVDTDRIAREIVAPGQPALAAVVAAFGEGILDPSGGLDRAAMRRRVFADPQARGRLESILHPRIRAESRRRLAATRAPYAVLVVPLLVETGQAPEIDRVLVVDVPESLQIARTMARDDLDRATVGAILDSQAKRSERLAAADDVIENTADLETLRRAVATLHHRYLALAGSVAGPAAEVKE